MTFLSANLMRISTNVNPSAAWAQLEELSGSSEVEAEVEAVIVRAGLPQAPPLSMFFLLFVSYGYRF
jgi:hypothetical protein